LNSKFYVSDAAKLVQILWRIFPAIQQSVWMWRNYYFARGSGCKVLWWVCLSVCLCVSACLSARISLEPHERSLPNFCSCYLWWWLGPPWASLRYVMYFRFCGWHHDFSIMGHIAAWN